MNKAEALKLVGDLAAASIRHYRVVNGEARGSTQKACAQEIKAAKKLVQALTPEPVTDEEIDQVMS